MRWRAKATVAVAVVSLFAGLATSASAGVVAFEWTEGSNSNFQSFHNVTGPVLADDFTPIFGGPITTVEWWGTRATSDRWELTIHADANGLPAFTAPNGGLSQIFATAVGTDANNDGIFHFSAAWTAPLALAAGTDYWFSVANNSSGWNWAHPTGGGPTVGSQQYAAVRSVGGDPSQIAGPHDGPWVSLVDADFAFRINVVPVPPAAWLGVGLLSMLAGAGWLRRRR